MATIQKRQPARIVSIKQLQSGEYIEKEGWEPNYVQVDNQQISRVNIMGIIVELPNHAQTVEPFTPIDSFQATLDDGSSTIELRSFNPITVADQITVGTPVLVIARPRIYQDRLFLSVEIIRKVTSEDIQERKTALGDHSTPLEKEEQTETIKTPNITLLEQIEQNDTGEGILIEDLIKEDKANKERIENLLLNGDIFEVRPGRIKVLK